MSPTLSTAVVHAVPGILGGVPVFVGTRVLLKALFDYLAGGRPLAECLDDFPSVAPAQAVATLRLANQSVVMVAPSNDVNDLLPLASGVLTALFTVRPGDAIW